MANITFPLETETDFQAFQNLKAGTLVKISGIIYTARDQAHKKMLEMIENGQALPFDPKGNAIYYCGPTPPREDKGFGSAGPTTSARMDKLSPPLMELGLAATIGKGGRHPDFRQACEDTNALYLTTFGGAGAYLAKCIVKQELIAFPELGAEAVYRLNVVDFPATVAYDIKGGSIFD